MRDYAIDGVFLQRFTSPLQSEPHRAFRNKVLREVISSAEANGRVFALMYDISGHDASTLQATIQADWRFLVDDIGITRTDRYLRHHGRPLIALWGFGFRSRAPSASQAQSIISFFKNNPDPRYRATVLGGVPSGWRTLTRDSKPEPQWHNVYRSFDIISPWTVGRYATDRDADGFRREFIEPDIALTRRLGIESMPVIFPGFSWRNLRINRDQTTATLNQTPRRGGRFYWRQVYNALGSDARMLYTAMFDEVDEGTAMYKLAANVNDQPVQGQFLTLDADGERLPSDWYLRLAGEANRAIRNRRRVSPRIPISPNAPPPTTPPPMTPPPTTPPPTTPPPTTPVATDAERQVTLAYRGILGREADASGKSYYLSQFNQGLTVHGLCQILFRSPEYRGQRGHLGAEALATALYQGILGRAPDSAGGAHTVELIRQGRQVARAASMIDSDEAKQNFTP